MNSNQPKIKKTHFWKYLTSQPFFIWNTLNIENNLQSEDQDRLDELLDLVNLKPGFESYFYHNDLVEYFQLTNNYRKIIDQKAIKTWINLENAYYVNKKMSLEKRAKSTLEQIALNKDVIYPVFKYKNSYSEPLAFLSKKKVVIAIRYARKVGVKDIALAHFDLSIIKESCPNVEDYKLTYVETRSNLKNDVSIAISDFSYPTKTTKNPAGEVSKARSSSKIYFKTLIDNHVITVNKKSFELPSANKFINDINKAIGARFNLKRVRQDVLGLFGENFEWPLILEQKASYFSNFSAKVITKKEMVEHLESNDNQSSYNGQKYLDYVKLSQNQITNKNLVKKIVDKLTIPDLIVWFDFEGLSAPISVIDHSLPSIQIVFQVSVIETIASQEVNVKNIVLDPAIFKLLDLYNMICRIYNSDAAYYVVYFKGYELTAIKNIAIMLENGGYSKESSHVYEMRDEIESKIVDLYDLFRYSSIEKPAAIILHDQKFKGSIKNLEKHITKNKIKIKTRFTPYSTLDIRNGLMAAQVAIKRQQEIIGTKEWESNIENLKKYCENDVLSMLMVFEFVKKLYDEENSK